MRRLLLLVLAAAPLLATAPARANVYCADLGPVPGYGPVCTVRCAMTAVPEEVDPSPKDLVRGMLDDPCWIQD